jgi:hypothetical protein
MRLFARDEAIHVILGAFCRVLLGAILGKPLKSIKAKHEPFQCKIEDVPYRHTLDERTLPPVANRYGSLSQ